MGNGARVNLLRSDSVPAPESFLSGPELEKLAALKIEKRRRDWLGGRYAAKTLLKGSFVPEMPLSAMEISYDPLGRPVLKSGGENSRLISITHSGPFCAAAAGPDGTTFLGIDLEKAEPRDAAWYQDYFYKSELAAAAGGIEGSETRDERRTTSREPLATIRWTQKEALLKALGLGLKADLLDINLTGGAPEFSRTALKRYEDLGKPPFALATRALGDDPAAVWFLSVVS